MKLSAAAGPIWREYGLNETQIFTILAECGFAYADYDFCPANLNDWLSADPVIWGRQVRSSLSDAGIKPLLAHVSGFNPFSDERTVEKAIICAGELGAENLVIPLAYAPDNTRREYEDCNLRYLERMLSTAEKADVVLLIEHSGSWLLPHYTHHALELNRMMERLSRPERLKINLNVGHIGIAEIKPYTEIKLLGESIRSVDLSDNFGGMPLAVRPEREELGLAPMMGYIDYDRVMQGLSDVSYDGCFNLRMNMPRVFEKASPYHSQSPLRLMPSELTKRLYIWSRHIAEHMLASYGCV